MESNTEGSTIQEGRHRGSRLNAAHPLPLRGVQEGLTTHLGRKNIVTEMFMNQNQIILDQNAQEASEMENMMAGWQTQRGPDRRMILGTRSSVRIGCWNVQTMFQAGKTEIVLNEMIRYQAQILGLSETRWIGTGEENLREGVKLIYSGHSQQNARHTQGVAFMLSKSAQKSLKSWEPHGPRIIEAFFKTSMKNIDLRVVMCYAPTNEAEDTAKDDFYRKLESVIQKKYSAKDILMLMGDVNSKVGNNNDGYERIMGTHGLGIMNNNGERFADFCLENNLVIGGTVFPHKTNHKYTWTSPGDRVRNQIDHICISKKFRRSLLDVRTKRGADCNSDHNLVIAKIQLKLKSMKNENSSREKYNLNKLVNPDVNNEFTLKLTNKFAILTEVADLHNDTDDDTETVETVWEHMKKSYNEVCKDVLGKKKRDEDEWLSENSQNLIEQRKEIKSKLCNSDNPVLKESYRIMSKRIKKSVRRDKRDYIEALAAKAESAAARNNSKEVYNITKKLINKKTSSTSLVRDRQGSILSTFEEQQARWVEHFNSVLNRPAPVGNINIPETDEDLDINIAVPTKEEILKSISSLKNGKAAGPDDIPAEAMKASQEVSADALEILLRKIWDKNKVPQDWRDGHLTVLPKKGDLSICDNHRGIMLLSTPGKVLSKILLERLKSAIDKKLRKNQAGFRSGRSCSDQIITLRIIIEQCLEMRKPCIINFVDYQKAFDSLDRNTLWKILAFYGVPKKIIDIIKSMYENQNVKVLFKGKLSNSFIVLTGVRQGCLLSPFLFLLAIDFILRYCNNGNGFPWIADEELDDLDFADDLAVTANTIDKIQEKTNEIKERSEAVGLLINVGKTKTMRINIDDNSPVKLDGEDIEDVDSFTYLGSILNKEGGTQEDVNNRLKKARTAFGMLTKIWRSTSIRTNTKIKIFNSNVKSVLFYGSESWSLTKKLETKIQVFINNCLRKILKIFWPQVITNIELWNLTNQLPVQNQIKKRKYGWIGHTLRRPTFEVQREALTWDLAGSRRRGAPRLTWRRKLTSELSEIGKTWDDIENLAQVRTSWRRFVNSLSPPVGQ